LSGGYQALKISAIKYKSLTLGTITGEYADVNGLELASIQFSQLLGDNIFLNLLKKLFYFKSFDLLSRNMDYLKLL